MSMKRSRISPGAHPRTTTSLLGEMRTKPSTSSRWSACMTGMRLIPALAATEAATMRSPGAKRPSTMARRRSW